MICHGQRSQKSSIMDIRAVIRQSSNLEPEEVFDSVVRSIESYFSRRVNDLQELKARECKKLKGDVWEEFCYQYLLSLEKYTSVWKWKEVPPEVKETLGLHRREDNGIDIVCKQGKKFIAVQCKYRKRGKVPWSTLSTFVGMCSTTGPWYRCLVMTNCKGVTRKVARREGDVSWCGGTFRKRTPREVWMRMAGFDTEGQKLGGEKVKSIEEMKLARLKKFCPDSEDK